MTEEPATREILRTLLEEAAAYGRDLARLFRAELNEKLRSIRVLAAMAGAAALILAVSFLFLTWALVGAIAYGLSSWRWSFLIVGVGYGFAGLMLLAPLASALRRGLFSFAQTTERLKHDAQWVRRTLAEDCPAPDAQATPNRAA